MGGKSRKYGGVSPRLLAIIRGYKEQSAGVRFEVFMELWKKLNKNMDEILTIEGHIKENSLKLNQIEEKYKTEQEIYEFYKNNEREFESLYKQIDDLDSIDRKLLVEAMLERPIRVGFKERDNKYIEQPSYPTIDIKIKFNPEILMRFATEGKLRFKKDSTNDNSSSYT
jgi:hypothetical protein